MNPTSRRPSRADTCAHVEHLSRADRDSRVQALLPATRVSLPRQVSLGTVPAPFPLAIGYFKERVSPLHSQISFVAQ
jgi:hypothetical protein